MKLLQALIPEILVVSSVLMASIAMLVLMGWPYALIFFSAFLLVASAYVNNVMQTELDE